jgi:uncharacterized damage-inducible protein DinB
MSNVAVIEYRDQLARLQAEMIDELSNLAREELRYATTNARANTLRRVLLRFGEHMREHTTQLVAAREDIGAAPTMPQRMLARAQESYGEMLAAMVGLSDDALDTVPEPGEWTPRQILEHIMQIQTVYLNLVREARQSADPVEKD